MCLYTVKQPKKKKKPEKQCVDTLPKSTDNVTWCRSVQLLTYAVKWIKTLIHPLGCFAVHGGFGDY